MWKEDIQFFQLKLANFEGKWMMRERLKFATCSAKPVLNYSNSKSSHPKSFQQHVCSKILKFLKNERPYAWKTMQMKQNMSFLFRHFRFVGASVSLYTFQWIVILKTINFFYGTIFLYKFYFVNWTFVSPSIHQYTVSRWYYKLIR